MKAFTSTLAFALLAAVAGCGSLSGDPNSERVLTTLHGQLDNPQSVALANSNVRVAVIWRNVTDLSNPFSVAEDLPVQPVFPSAFEIDITAPPPASAMNSGAALAEDEGSPQTTGTSANGSSSSASGGSSGGAQTPTPSSGGGSSSASNASGRVHLNDVTDPSQIPADFAFAVGQVVAYQDVNQNGKLDLVSDGATSYTDQIVGANQSLMLIYLSGSLPSAAGNFLTDSTGKNPSLGYNLYQTQACEVTPGGNDNCNGTQWFDMSTLYDLPVSNDPTFNDLMCQDGEGSSSSGANAVDPTACISQPGTAQASYPAAATVACSSDGSYFTTDACTTLDQGPCKGTLTSCTTSMVCRPSGVVPANWPCAATGN